MEEFDYVVVGAGSAGCVVAARLSEDPNARVLLLEAGGSDSLVDSMFLADVHPAVMAAITTPEVSCEIDGEALGIVEASAAARPGAPPVDEPPRAA